jgi:hypothetical protein
MTVINNIEIDNIYYETNYIKYAILNNEPIEEKLNVIMVISNPCLYAIRYVLAREFIRRMEMDEPNINLYIVELVYDNQKFIITDKNNKRHLQLKSKTPLWHKENMINIGIKKLLPSDWKAVAWIDADIEFESPTWAIDTLKILNGYNDIVQIFSHALDMNKDGYTMRVFSSGGFQYSKKHKYISNGPDYWHPGFAWACTRKAYEKIGGLYELGILGSGDNIMALSLIRNGLKAVNENTSENYKNSILEFQKNISTLRFGYIPGVIRHYYHGSKKNRKYTERWHILLKHGYEPDTFITKDKNGLLIPTEKCSQELLNEIYNYFLERNEDEDFSGR